MTEEDPDLVLLPLPSGFLAMYKWDLPVDYAEEFINNFTKKTGSNVVLLVNCGLATKEKIDELRSLLKEAYGN